MTLFCDWLSCVRTAENRFEWETRQTQFSGQIKHKVRDIWNGFQDNNGDKNGENNHKETENYQKIATKGTTKRCKMTTNRGLTTIKSFCLAYVGGRLCVWAYKGPLSHNLTTEKSQGIIIHLLGTINVFTKLHGSLYNYWDILCWTKAEINGAAPLT